MLTSDPCLILQTGLEMQHSLLKSHPSPSCHSARRVYPELQNLIFLIAKEILLSFEKVAVRADEGLKSKGSFLTVTHCLQRPLYSLKAVLKS